VDPKTKLADVIPFEKRLELRVGIANPKVHWAEIVVGVIE